jgi:hypothetical protein
LFVSERVTAARVRLGPGLMRLGGLAYESSYRTFFKLGKEECCKNRSFRDTLKASIMASAASHTLSTKHQHHSESRPRTEQCQACTKDHRGFVTVLIPQDTLSGYLHTHHVTLSPPLGCQTTSYR